MKTYIFKTILGIHGFHGAEDETHNIGNTYGRLVSGNRVTRPTPGGAQCLKSRDNPCLFMRNDKSSTDDVPTNDESASKPVDPRGPQSEIHEDPGHARSIFERYLPVPSGSKRCPVSGFSPATFRREVLDGPGRDHVRIVSLRKPGKSRGQHLYHAGDLLRWLDRLAEEHARREAPPHLKRTFPQSSTTSSGPGREDPIKNEDQETQP